MAKVTIKQLAQNRKWDIICGDEEALNRQIYLADVNRPGLELTGYFDYSQKKRLIVLGDKEVHYILNEMDEIAQRLSFEQITSDKTPGILLTKDLDCPPILLEICQRKNFPVFRTHRDTTHAVINIINYLDEALAESVIIHGELLNMYGMGVVIVGDSGMGKSEIALELIKKGHQLIADDRIDCYRIHNKLVGKTPDLLEGFMELRGVGIINIARMYGIQAYAHQARIELIIRLESFDETADYDRVGIEGQDYEEILGLKIMKMHIPVTMGRPMSTIIETAVTYYMLIRDGKDSAQEFENKVIERMQKNKEELDESLSD